MLLVFLMAVSLSMDAFSLALVYGTLGMSRKYKILLAIIVGFYHLIMPIFGMFIGNMMLSLFDFNYDILVALILCFIGIQMVISSFKKDEEVQVLKLTDLFLFGLAVSIDSFSLGITLPNLNVNLFIAPFVFSLVSGFLTFIGLSIGNKIENLLGKIATVIGGVILTVLGIIFAI